MLLEAPELIFEARCNTIERWRQVGVPAITYEYRTGQVKQVIAAVRVLKPLDRMPRAEDR